MKSRALLLYRLIQLLSFPFVLIYFAVRLLLDRSYWKHFGERLGLLPQSFTRTKAGSIWLHAVSVGEIASAIPLIRQLRADHPQTPFYLSTGTVAGRKAALQQASALVDGIFYAPIDYAFFVRRVLSIVRPALVIILETEIWMNLYAETHYAGARLAIVNGRISNRTWPRYEAFAWFFSQVLQFADLVLVQSPADFERYRKLGAPAQRLSIAGNLKYDAATTTRTQPDWPAFDAEQIWIAASTVGPNERGSLTKHAIDEDDIVLRAFRKLIQEFPRMLLILAPRQPARFAEVASKLGNSGLHWQRRTTLDGSALQLPGVLLLDSIGELAGLYKRADVVFVGGSLAPRGGHNIIEPAAAGVPIVVGPHMHNFETIARDFIEHQAMVQIQQEEDLASAIRDLLRNPRRASEIGKHALHFVRSQQGVSRSIAERLRPLYQAANPRTPHSTLAYALLVPLAFIWKIGGAFKRTQLERTAASLLPLAAPVVSVGGISVGGSGKTPFTNYLTERLKARGYSPAILTRGYRRRFPAANLVFGPGAKVSSLMTGDEAQIFLRAGAAPVGIGAKRYETAQILMRQFPETDVLVLDDGFQHARIDRDFDIVMIDGLDPFGQGELVPLGRLREPLSALRRADVFVVTRADNDLRFDFIRSRLHEFNPTAPVFRTRLAVRCWRDYRSGTCLTNMEGRRVAAFCGLGNPQNFWRTLESLGLKVVFQWAFDDHHPYKPYELSRLAHQARMHGAELLVTTEKDRINCPNHLEKAIAPMDLAWLEIELELDDETAFFQDLERVLRKRRPAGLAS